MYQQPESFTRKVCVSVAEAAFMLSCCRKTIENYMSAGLLPSKKLGRRRLILVRDLERFIAADKPSPRKQ